MLLFNIKAIPPPFLPGHLSFLRIVYPRDFVSFWSNGFPEGKQYQSDLLFIKDISLFNLFSYLLFIKDISLLNLFSESALTFP